MDLLKSRLFIKDLNYDLETVRYLLDYNRLKETAQIIERILDNIDSFRADHLDDGLNNIFSHDFWNNKLPATMSFAQMHAYISKYAHSKSPLVEEDLNKIEYRSFVKNVFAWADENIPKIRHAAKSPIYKKIERKLLCLIGIIAGLSLVIISGSMFLTKDWGLKGDFYRGEKFGKYLYSGYKKTINFSSSLEMNLKLPNDNFSDRWTGYLLTPKAGEYRISAYGDDGVKVFIDSKLLITGTWYGGESSKKIFLTQGSHKIMLEHFQIGGPSALKLYWVMAGGKKEIIPAKYLRH